MMILDFTSFPVIRVNKYLYPFYLPLRSLMCGIPYLQLPIKEESMNPWLCALLITVAGAIGGVVNALLTDNGFILPRRERRIWCPGFITNVLVGAFSAFSSWAFYGSGAAVELAQINQQMQVSLRFSALAGA